MLRNDNYSRMIYLDWSKDLINPVGNKSVEEMWETQNQKTRPKVCTLHLYQFEKQVDYWGDDD